MAKLFLTLYLSVLASFAVFIFYTVSFDYLGGKISKSANIEEKISKGIFMLLSDSVEGLNKQKTDKLIKEYKKLFGDGFMLVEQADLSLDNDDLSILNDKKVLAVEENKIFNKKSKEVLSDSDTVTILYFKRHNTTQVWRLELDYDTNISINESGLLLQLIDDKFSNGMMVLVQSRLLSHSPAEWPDILKQLQINFGLPLSLVTLDNIPPNINHREQIIASIEDDKTVNISQGSNIATFVKQMPDSQQLLQIGPIEIPWYVQNMSLLMILAFGLSFATTLSLWLWPLWSSLINMKKAADAFGKGDYSVRIPNKKLSPIKKITNAFNAMAEQTQRNIRSQKELTSAVSHELRTPVARMRFALEMLDASNKKEDKSRYVTAINKDIDELDLLLEELLTYARFDQNNHRISQVAVKLIPWISTSMEKLMPLAINHSLDYKVEGIGNHETSLLEPRLMSRVVDNLVQNALRYAKHAVNVTFTKDHNDYLLIVEDDGIGIAEDQREHIFDAFSRIDASRDRASGGFGLGLAIVDRIIKAHQGNISVHDSTLGGARFEVRIPAKK